MIALVYAFVLFLLSAGLGVTIGKAWSDWDAMVSQGKLFKEIGSLRDQLGSMETVATKIANQRDEAENALAVTREQLSDMIQNRNKDRKTIDNIVEVLAAAAEN